MAHRPPPHLAVVVVALVVSSLAGLHLSRGAYLPAASLAGVALLGVGFGLARRVPWWLSLLALASFASGLRADPAAALAREAGPSRDALRDARSLPVVGRWRSTGRSRGRVEPPAGGGHVGHRLLFELATEPPEEGAWTVVLPGGDVVPAPEGPVRSRAARARAARGIVASSRVHPDELVALPRAPRLPRAIGEALDSLRTSVALRADKLESEGIARGLVRALLLGERSRVDGETLDLFTRTGTRHLLALSGLHVGLLAGALLFPLSTLVLWLPFLRRRRGDTRRRLVGAIRLTLLGTFVALVGAGDPITRAGCALAFGIVGPFVHTTSRAPWELGRRPDGLALWAFALLVELVVDPLGLESVSLQLSYLATLGILLGTGPIDRGLRSLVPKPLDGDALPRGLLLLTVRAVSRRLGRVARTGVAASLAAVLATLPVVASQFGEICPLGVLLTPLVLPQVALVLVLAWVGVLLDAGSAVSPVAPLSPLAELVPWLAESLCSVLRLGDACLGTPVVLPPRPPWLAWALVGLVFLALRSPAERSHGLVRGAFALAALWLLPWVPRPAGFELHMIDVGHGSSAVLRAPGVPALIFDAGSRDRRWLFAEALRPLLAKWEVARPWIVVSHDHADHHSALPRLLERFPAALWMGALPEQLGERLAHDVRRLDADLGSLGIGTAGPLELHLLRGSDRPGNEGSRSLTVTWRGETLLLTGDAEAEGLAWILAHGGLPDRLRLVFLPHHGSDTDLLGRFLARLRPREAWISEAHRAPVAAELERRGVPWRGTHAEGPLALALP